MTVLIRQLTSYFMLGLSSCCLLLLYFPMTKTSSEGEIRVTLTVSRNSHGSLVVEIKAFNTSDGLHLPDTNITKISSESLQTCWEGYLTNSPHLISLRGVLNSDMYNGTTSRPYCSASIYSLGYHANIRVYSTLDINIERLATGRCLTTIFNCTNQNAHPQINGDDVKTPSIHGSSEEVPGSSCCEDLPGPSCRHLSNEQTPISIDITCRESVNGSTPTTRTDDQTVSSSTTITFASDTSLPTNPPTTTPIVNTGITSMSVPVSTSPESTTSPMSIVPNGVMDRQQNPSSGNLPSILGPTLSLIVLLAVAAILVVVFIRKRRKAFQSEKPSADGRNRSMLTSNPAFSDPPEQLELVDECVYSLADEFEELPRVEMIENDIYGSDD